jgi:hypothetical protein
MRNGELIFPYDISHSISIHDILKYMNKKRLTTTLIASLVILASVFLFLYTSKAKKNDSQQLENEEQLLNWSLYENAEYRFEHPLNARVIKDVISPEDTHTRILFPEMPGPRHPWVYDEDMIRIHRSDELLLLGNTQGEIATILSKESGGASVVQQEKHSIVIDAMHGQAYIVGDTFAYIIHFLRVNPDTMDWLTLEERAVLEENYAYGEDVLERVCMSFEIVE